MGVDGSLLTLAVILPYVWFKGGCLTNVILKLPPVTYPPLTTKD